MGLQRQAMAAAAAAAAAERTRLRSTYTLSTVISHSVHLLRAQDAEKEDNNGFLVGGYVETLERDRERQTDRHTHTHTSYRQSVVVALPAG